MLNNHKSSNTAITHGKISDKKDIRFLHTITTQHLLNTRQPDLNLIIQDLSEVNEN